MLAAARGLFHTANLVGDPKRQHLLPSNAPADALLSQPFAAEPLALLTQMIRRGPDPHGVELLLQWLSGRPIEQGLLAWDALWGSMPTLEDQPLIHRWRELALPLLEILPPAGTRGASFIQWLPGDFIREKMDPPEDLEAALLDHDLTALEFARTTEGYEDLAVDPELRNAVRAFAQLLALAHFPTLATFYLGWTWSTLGDEKSLDLLLEILLDVDRANGAEGLPQRFASPEHREWGEYIVCRNAISEGDPAAAWELLQSSIQAGRSVLCDGKKHPRMELVRAELAARINQLPLPLEEATRIANENPMWPYAWRVRARLAALAGNPIAAVDDYLGTFGNDARFWADQFEQAPLGAPWLADLGARLQREAIALPHDLAVWSGMVGLLSGDERAVGEIQQRRLEQTRF